MHIRSNFSLKELNTFGLNVTCDFYVEIQYSYEILTLRKEPKFNYLPWMVIGSGSNVFFTTEHIKRLFVKSINTKISIVQEDDENVWLSVGAGCLWDEVVLYTCMQNWWGIENMAAIPGTVGACPVQNIGAYGVEVRDVITRVETIDLVTGVKKIYRNQECKFSYRSSIFKHEAKDQYLINRVTLKLKKQKYGSPILVNQSLMNSITNNKIKQKNLTPLNLYHLICEIRNSKLPDYKKYGNVGSFFKNPIVSKQHFSKILNDYSDIPYYKVSDDCYKFSAAWLIEQSGCKGKSIGDAEIYKNHALVVINRGAAIPEDIILLTEFVQDKVNTEFGVHLISEVNWIS